MTRQAFVQMWEAIELRRANSEAVDRKKTLALCRIAALATRTSSMSRGMFEPGDCRAGPKAARREGERPKECVPVSGVRRSAERGGRRTRWFADARRQTYVCPEIRVSVRAETQSGRHFTTFTRRVNVVLLLPLVCVHTTEEF